MNLPTFTVTRKVAIGYLLAVGFSLVAIVYALSHLHDQVTRSEQLVSVDFKALNLSQSLRQNLLAQESLARQVLILRDEALLDLLDRRQEEFATLYNEFRSLPLHTLSGSISSLAKGLQRRSDQCRELLAEKDWESAEFCFREEVWPRRNTLISDLDTFTREQQKLLDRSLMDFTNGSARAYRGTLALAFAGILLSAPVAITVILSMHRSIRALTRATKEISEGSFDRPIVLNRRDEFGILAREFNEMGRKLRELEQLRLDANPLTHLPGNLALEREMSLRIQSGKHFAHLYIDLDNFKAYNDRYGYRAGSEVISRMAEVIQTSVSATTTAETLIGHIGGDDFVILATSLEEAEKMAETLARAFDEMVPGLYNEADRAAGHFTAEDRFGVKRVFPLLTISIAIVWSGHLDSPDPQTISRECVRMKEHLKSQPGSNIMINRRRNP